MNRQRNILMNSYSYLASLEAYELAVLSLLKVK